MALRRRLSNVACFVLVEVMAFVSPVNELVLLLGSWTDISRAIAKGKSAHQPPDDCAENKQAPQCCVLSMLSLLHS